MILFNTYKYLPSSFISSSGPAIKVPAIPFAVIFPLLTVYEPKNELIPEEPLIESVPIFSVKSPNLSLSDFGGILSPDISVNLHEVFSSEEILFLVSVVETLLQLKSSKVEINKNNNLKCRVRNYNIKCNIPIINLQLI